MNTQRTDEEFDRQLTELILDRGISSLSVGEMAAQLRCSRRRLYELATTKEKLFLRVVSQTFDSMLQEGHEAAARESGAARAVAAYLNVGAARSAQISVACLEDLESTRQGRKLLDAYQAKRTQGLRSLLDAGVAGGEFAAYDSRVVAEVLLGAAQRLRRPAFLSEAGLTLEAALRELYALVLDGLLSRPTQRSGANANRARAALRADRSIA